MQKADKVRAYDIIKAHYDASARGDFAGMMAPISGNTLWVEMAGLPFEGSYVGREAIVTGPIRQIQETFSAFAFELERLIDGGNCIIGLGCYQATVRATGKCFRCRVTHVWDVADETVVRFENIVDTFPMMQAFQE